MSGAVRLGPSRPPQRVPVGRGLADPGQQPAARHRLVLAGDGRRDRPGRLAGRRDRVPARPPAPVRGDAALRPVGHHPGRPGHPSTPGSPPPASWLQALGTEPDLAQAQVTVETAPDSGTQLARVVDRQRGPAAPQLATEVLGEVVDTYPRAAARAETRVTLTFGAPEAAATPLRRPGTARRRRGDVPAHRRPPAATAAALRNAGAGEAVPMSAADLAACCRLAYDPAAAPDLAVTGAGPIVWSDAGPVAADEARTHYVHDSGVSVSSGYRRRAAVPAARHGAAHTDGPRSRAAAEARDDHLPAADPIAGRPSRRPAGPRLPVAAGPQGPAQRPRRPPGRRRRRHRRRRSRRRRRDPLRDPLHRHRRPRRRPGRRRGHHPRPGRRGPA